MSRQREAFDVVWSALENIGIEADELTDPPQVQWTARATPESLPVFCAVRFDEHSEVLTVRVFEELELAERSANYALGNFATLVNERIHVGCLDVDLFGGTCEMRNSISFLDVPTFDPKLVARMIRDAVEIYLFLQEAIHKVAAGENLFDAFDEAYARRAIAS